MSRSSRWAAELGLGAAVLVLAGCLFVVFQGSTTAVASDPALPGSVARNFRLPDLDRAVLSLDSFRGKVVVAVFTGDCDTSADAFSQSLTQAMQTFADMPQVSLLAVRSEPDGLAEDESCRLRSILGDLNWKHPTLVDGNAGITRKYNVGSVPTIFVIDGKGVIRFRKECTNSGTVFNQCRQTVTSLLSQS